MRRIRILHESTNGKATPRRAHGGKAHTVGSDGARFVATLAAFHITAMTVSIVNNINATKRVKVT